MTQIIDGKAFAANVRSEIAAEIAANKYKIGLTVVLVGADPASQVYVKNKDKAASEVGIKANTIKLIGSVTQKELLKRIHQLNIDESVHGILVQLPLPAQIDETAVINAIAPEKDVDGFHVINAGRAVTGQDGLVPCTPYGCILMLKDVLGSLSGLNAVVIGRSNIVGKPMANLLLNENCTVTIAHSRTKNLPEICAQADIVVAAVGKPKMVKASWVKQGAVVIDVGINRTEDGKLVGDVDFEEVAPKCKAITPVPGGVGPMTIACLLQNTLTAYKFAHDID
jgi:methylenetetrahydrofolate dehydrogenase (NADP+)/methenyltetrahydrofolate cyclohydrolase